MTKYEPKHEWVKEIGLKKGMAEMADSATDHISAILDKSDVKDIAFLSSWITLAILMMQTKATRKLIESVEGANALYFHGSINPLQWGLIWDIVPYIEGILWPQPAPATDQEISDRLTEIGLSLVISYFILTQGGSIINAISAIGGKLL